MRYLLLIFLMGLSNSTYAQSSADRIKQFNVEKGIAIKGYDPVAYFSKQAVKGSKKYAANYQGLTYYFSSEKHKEIFLKNPSQYEPQYGGWCAFAMGDNGKRVKINPKTYKISNGKLYLFYKTFFNNTLDRWNEDESKLKAKANSNWAKMFY